MTMRSIANAEYAKIENINITIIGYSIGTEDVEKGLQGAWAECKETAENWFALG